MMKLFSGTSNRKLSQEVAQILEIKLSKAEIVRFDNSEVKITVQEDVRNKTAIIIQATDNPTDSNLMELFLFADALYRQEAKKVIAFIPYFGYARQDIQHRPGECISANVVIKFLEKIGFYKIYTFDIHDEATGGVFSIPFKNISAFPILVKRIKEFLGNETSPEKIAIVSPDQGGIERARLFQELFFPGEKLAIGVVEKKRDLDKVHQSKALAIYGEVKEKIVILVDDIATSGKTLINSAKLCKENGAKKVIAALVHHDFADNTSRDIQNSAIDYFFTTNSINLKEKYNFPKLVEVSIAPLIANEIKKMK